jgi:hypothetical protein
VGDAIGSRPCPYSEAFKTRTCVAPGSRERAHQRWDANGRSEYRMLKLIKISNPWVDGQHRQGPYARDRGMVEGHDSRGRPSRAMPPR